MRKQKPKQEPWFTVNPRFNVKPLGSITVRHGGNLRRAHTRGPRWFHSRYWSWQWYGGRRRTWLWSLDLAWRQWLLGVRWGPSFEMDMTGLTLYLGPLAGRLFWSPPR